MEVVRPSAVLLVAAVVACQVPAATTPDRAIAACGTPGACEQRMAARLEAVRGDRAGLTELLRRFPKGGDLHNHASGAVWAESYLAWAREDGFVLDDDQKLVDPASCATTHCSPLPASPEDPRFDAVLRAWSMKDFQPGGETGHDHFFTAFSKFRMVTHLTRHDAAIYAEAIRRAADDGAIYLELMVSVAHAELAQLVHDVGELDPADLAGYERKLHADPRWPQLIAGSRDHFAESVGQARALLGCSPASTAAVCRITVRYLAQASRVASRASVFAELLAAFDLAALEPAVVGINLVAPEDNRVAVTDYDLHMAMIRAIADAYLGANPVRIALHAGELVPALVPDGTAASHIRKAVEIARAERIGHGVDVRSDPDWAQLLAELRDRRVTVEICLTSNASILGVSGPAHPLAAYLAAGVPVVLATDDAGVSRSSLTGELVRAVVVQGLTYPQLKAIARQSLTAAFIAGASLWAPGGPPALVEPCAAGVTAAPSPRCAAFLATSERARLQWTLETQLAAFEVGEVSAR
jgi:hypothetical protein